MLKETPFQLSFLSPWALFLLGELEVLCMAASALEAASSSMTNRRRGAGHLSLGKKVPCPPSMSDMIELI